MVARTETGATPIFPVATTTVCLVTALTFHIAWLKAVAPKKAVACPTYPSATVAEPPDVLSVTPSSHTLAMTAAPGSVCTAPAASVSEIALAAPPCVEKSYINCRYFGCTESVLALVIELSAMSAVATAPACI